MLSSKPIVFRYQLLISEEQQDGKQKNTAINEVIQITRTNRDNTRISQYHYQKSMFYQYIPFRLQSNYLLEADIL